MASQYSVSKEAAIAIAAGVSAPKAFREAGRISPSDMGRWTRISAERMLQIEEGADATDDEIIDISNALGVPVEMLISS